MMILKYLYIKGAEMSLPLKLGLEQGINQCVNKLSEECDIQTYEPETYFNAFWEKIKANNEKLQLFTKDQNAKEEFLNMMIKQTKDLLEDLHNHNKKHDIKPLYNFFPDFQNSTETKDTQTKLLKMFLFRFINQKKSNTEDIKIPNQNIDNANKKVIETFNATYFCENFQENNICDFMKYSFLLKGMNLDQTPNITKISKAAFLELKQQLQKTIANHKNTIQLESNSVFFNNNTRADLLEIIQKMENRIQETEITKTLIAQMWQKIQFLEGQKTRMSNLENNISKFVFTNVKKENNNQTRLEYLDYQNFIINNIPIIKSSKSFIDETQIQPNIDTQYVDFEKEEPSKIEQFIDTNLEYLDRTITSILDMVTQEQKRDPMTLLFITQTAIKEVYRSKFFLEKNKNNVFNTNDDDQIYGKILISTFLVLAIYKTII